MSAPLALRQFPHTTWMRIARVIEGSVTVAVLIAASTSREARAASPSRSIDHHARRDEWAGATARDRAAARPDDPAASSRPIDLPRKPGVSADLGRLRSRRARQR